jgi:hypothetical protein
MDLGKKICVQKYSKSSKNLKNQKSKNSDLLNGKTRPSYLYARKKIIEKKLILRPVERTRHEFFRKS